MERLGTPQRGGAAAKIDGREIFPLNLSKPLFPLSLEGMRERAFQLRLIRKDKKVAVTAFFLAEGDMNVETDLRITTRLRQGRRFRRAANGSYR